MSRNFLPRVLQGAGGDGSAGGPLPDQDFRRTNVFFVAFLLLGLAFVFAHKYSNQDVYISTALMWVMSCLVSGAAVGFLFGIPKIYQGNKTVVDLAGSAPPPGGQQPAPPAGQPAAATARTGEASNYRQEVNTNLTEISDWLTKIIVGLGLIHLGQIPAHLDRMASSLAGGLNPAAPAAEKGFAFGLITCFSVFGFLSGYIYTRVFLSVLFSRSDQAALSKVSERAERANTIGELAIDKVKEASELTEQAIRAAKTATLAAETAKLAAKDAQTNAIGTGKSKEQPGEREAAWPEDERGDPLRGKFGGKSENNDRKLDANVVELTGVTDLFAVRLRVFSTKPEEKPLRGIVRFFLHPTFNNDQPVVTVGPDGVAELRLTAWGAFTVGALADDGKTELELNLADLEDAPETFRNR